MASRRDWSATWAWSHRTAPSRGPADGRYPCADGFLATLARNSCLSVLVSDLGVVPSDGSLTGAR